MSNCITQLNQRRVSISENGRKIVVKSDKDEEWELVQVDGCLITEGRRADYMVSVNDTTVIIELKGANLKHACEQIFCTVERKEIRQHLRKKLGLVVICSRYPKVNTSFQVAKQKARRKYSAPLRAFCNQREVRLNDIVK